MLVFMVLDILLLLAQANYTLISPTASLVDRQLASTLILLLWFFSQRKKKILCKQCQLSTPYFNLTDLLVVVNGWSMGMSSTSRRAIGHMLWSQQRHHAIMEQYWRSLAKQQGLAQPRRSQYLERVARQRWRRRQLERPLVRRRRRRRRRPRDVDAREHGGGAVKVGGDGHGREAAAAVEDHIIMASCYSCARTRWPWWVVLDLVVTVIVLLAVHGRHGRRRGVYEAVSAVAPLEP